MSPFAISPESGPTIRDHEQRIEQVLDRVRLTSDSTSREESLALLAELRDLIAPENFRCSVQLEEDGRKKRSSASARNWKFDTGEIVLFFEAFSNVDSIRPVQEIGSVISIAPGSAAPAKPDSLKIDIQQCCEALAEAERQGKQFIALKWFRDLALPGMSYPWSKTAEGRQRVLSAAIDSGAILLKPIPNPKSPMHPTTTVSLNRTSPLLSVPSRFNPVPIKGEPASVTLLRDRGNY